MRETISKAEEHSRGKGQQEHDSTTAPACPITQKGADHECRTRAPRTQLTLCRVPALSQAVLYALTVTDEVLDDVTVGEGRE